MTEDRTAEITKPLYYDDGEVVHACESCYMHAGPPVVMTQCGRHVPQGREFTLEYSAIEVTCAECLH